MTAPVCVDCIKEGVPSYRKPVMRNGRDVPGKRCTTHERARKTRASNSAWERRLMQIYGITAKEYWTIHEYQGGRCALCQRANGARKRLSVDHDHATGFVRGLLCGPCNRDVVGHLRDDPEAFLRGHKYLTDPPAISVIGKRVAPVEAPNLIPNGTLGPSAPATALPSNEEEHVGTIQD